MGKTHPKEFFNGLMRVMPLQVKTEELEDAPDFYENKEQIIQRLRERGLPNKVVEAITAQVFDALDSKQGKPKAGT